MYYTFPTVLFLVSFQILVQVLHILRELTIKPKAMDVVYAYKLVNKVVSSLKSMRTNSVSEFRKQLAEAARIAKKLNGDQFELTLPRLSGKHRHRSNPPSYAPEEYYRITLYDEFLSHVVSELEERFVNNPSHSITIGLLHLLPSECIKLGNDVMVPEDLAKAVDLFKGDLPHAVISGVARIFPKGVLTSYRFTYLCVVTCAYWSGACNQTSQL